MFHHVAMFRFRKDVSNETIADVRHRLLALPDSIGAIRCYHVGRDAGISDATWDMVVVARFDDEDGYREYSTHPEHVPVVQEIASLVTDRAAVQSGRDGNQLAGSSHVSHDLTRRQPAGRPHDAAAGVSS